MLVLPVLKGVRPWLKAKDRLFKQSACCQRALEQVTHLRVVLASWKRPRQRLRAELVACTGGAQALLRMQSVDLIEPRNDKPPGLTKA